MATTEKRISNEDAISYRVKVRLKEFPTQTATFERLTDAKKWIASTESAIREGRHFKTSESKKHNLKDLIDRYIKEILPQKPKSLIDQKTQLNWWKSEIGNYSLADINPSLLTEYRTKLSIESSSRKKLRTPSTCNRYCAALSHCFTIAIKEWEWMQENPMLKITKLKEPRGRARFLDDEEIKRLLNPDPSLEI